jgi:hypothetical protein
VRALLALTGGPLSGTALPTPAGYPQPWTPPDVIWVSRDAAGNPVHLQPDKELLDLVAARGDGPGWVPYRRQVDEPVRVRTAAVWRYGWDRGQDPSEQRARPGVVG